MFVADSLCSVSKQFSKQRLYLESMPRSNVADTALILVLAVIQILGYRINLITYIMFIGNIHMYVDMIA